MTMPKKWRYKIPYTLHEWLANQRSNPAVYARVQVALTFFRRCFPHYNDERLVSELVCQDYSRLLRVTSVPVGTQLVGYKPPTSNPLHASYFARVGTPLHRVGVGYVSAPDGSPPTSKKFFRYRVTTTVPEALETICAPARDMWSNELAWGEIQGGGAMQWVFPNASAHLEVV